MFCNMCGNQIPDGSKFCPACGAQQGGEAAPQAPQGAWASPEPQGYQGQWVAAGGPGYQNGY